MQKKGFTIIEIVIVFFVILAVTFFVLPKNLETTKQARFISQWSQKYSEFQYMFSVIKAQQDSEIHQKIKSAQDNNELNKILLDVIKPYLRIEKRAGVDYKQYYMSGEAIISSSKYYFENLYLTSSNEIVGLKWVNQNCKGKDICAMIDLDLNGLEAPNKWGYDIFGINILKNEIEPIGKGINDDILKQDCSSRGYGTYCSYYYLIGGRFD